MLCIASSLTLRKSSKKVDIIVTMRKTWCVHVLLMNLEHFLSLIKGFGQNKESSLQVILTILFQLAIAWQAVWGVWSSWRRTRTRESADKNLSGLSNTTQWTPTFQWLKKVLVLFCFLVLSQKRNICLDPNITWMKYTTNSLNRDSILQSCQPSCNDGFSSPRALILGREWPMRWAVST